MSERDRFNFLAFDAAVRCAQNVGLIEVWQSYETEGAITIRLTLRGRQAYRSLDKASQEEVNEVV